VVRLTGRRLEGTLLEIETAGAKIAGVDRIGGELKVEVGVMKDEVEETGVSQSPGPEVRKEIEVVVAGVDNLHLNLIRARVPVLEAGPEIVDVVDYLYACTITSAEMLTVIDKFECT